MIVTDAESDLEEPWQPISVMVFSLEIQFLSVTDIFIPIEISGLNCDVLAETWHIREMLACNLLNPVGRRLSRQVYDWLLTIDDFHAGAAKDFPSQDIQASGLKIGQQSAAADAALDAFHRREEAWSDVLTVPIAAYRVYLKGIQQTEQVLQSAIAVERETAAQHRINLSQWFNGLMETGWQMVSNWMEAAPTTAIATRSSDLNENSSAEPNNIAALIHQLQCETDEFQRRRIAKQLGESGTGHAGAIQALINLLRETRDDETLWATVESLWKLDPGNPSAGVRQVKLIDLGMQIASQAVALAVALVRKENQQVGVLLQVYPPENEPYLPANLKLVLLNASGQALREVVARQSDVYIQLKFSGEPREAFSVRVELGAASITENFVI
ncbi:DUF1822 family protein [Leptolyngbya sp. DQ-M1]|uniref:DUF1822 family protein n=1 Tax=Leptolyngbya sp. DQ-M1 TaxID=2933920 RepID=UPI0032985BF4